MSGLSSVAHGMVRKEDERRRSQQSANIDPAALDALRRSTSAPSRKTRKRDNSNSSFFSRHRPWEDERHSEDGRQQEDPFEPGALVEQTEPNTPADEDVPSYGHQHRPYRVPHDEYFSPISRPSRKSCFASAGPDPDLEGRARTDAHPGQLLTMPWSR